MRTCTLTLCLLLAGTGWAISGGGENPADWKSSRAAVREAKAAQDQSAIAAGSTQEVDAIQPVQAQASRVAEASADKAEVGPPAPQTYLDLTPDGTGFRVVRVPGAEPLSAAGGDGRDDEIMPEPCPEDALFSQRCATYEEDGVVGGHYSDVESGYSQYENFWDVRGDISGLSWYGVFMDDFMGNGCGSDPRDFEIKFYDDANDAPGTEVASYTVALYGEPTDMDVGVAAYATRYTLTLDPPLTLREGWVSIVATGDPDECIFSWLSDPQTDPPGDGRHCFEEYGEMECQVPGEPYSWDLNLCILGTFYPGACCDDLTGICTDGVEYVDCPEPMRFEADTLCADLDPNCGEITGACCEGETCTVMTPGECAAVGGVYKGDYVPCDPNPCVGACCLGNLVCEVYTEEDCLALGGDYVGDGTTCDPNPCPPINDDCANAEPVTEGAWPYDTTYATLDGPQSCELGQNVWFCYTASATGTVRVVVEQDPGTWWGPSGAVYDGCVCDPYPQVVTCDPWGEGMFDFDVAAGAQYLIEVGKYGGAKGRTVEGGSGTLSLSLDAWAYGACCSEEAPYCYECYEHECDGTFAGDGSTCDPSDCNGSGIPDACDLALGLSEDCNSNGIPDECDIDAGTSTDYDLNGVPDECDPDCNENGIVDACDIDCGTGNCSAVVGCGGSEDCQPDGIPDECQIHGEIEYLTDDGSSEDAVGLSDGGYLAWLTQLDVVEGFESVATISLAWADVPDGTPLTVYLWSDPDGNGNPNDAQVLSSAATVVANAGTDIFTTVDIPDAYVGPVGTSFFVGAIIEYESGYYPAALDTDETQFQSWFAANNDDPLDPNALADAPIGPVLIENYYAANWAGNWLLRAVGFFDDDCNGNGIPDECDIASGFSEDCNSNGVPDECEWVDCNGNGVLDDCDILECDGSVWCSDCNGNGVPDECDVPPIGDGQDCQPNGIPDECEEDCNANDIPDDCDIRDCDGSAWCDDCNENGIIDECDLGYPGGLVYQSDDGSAENTLGVLVGDDVELAWIQRFVVEPGSETIVAISTCVGCDEWPGWSGVEPGDPLRVFVWDDPNGDGAPYDAVLLASADATVNAGSIDTEVLQEIPIGPVTVSGSFFIGAAVTSDLYPAPMDEDGELAHESWVAYDLVDEGGFDPYDFDAYNMDDIGYPSNWLLRAISAITPAPNDCNGNGIPDDCDLCGDLDLDDDVDYYDYVIFLDAFGGNTDGSPSEDWCCDYDDSGAVGMADFDAWLSCYRDYIDDPLAGPPGPPNFRRSRVAPTRPPRAPTPSP